ncbi:MAG: OmpH family outer membrane protein [Bacteroidetes bacterium]|nr:OmpH family outer membrane protein [Bacteroidota bacterium]NCQ11055.1 OmpH family outer membrane protein [Bacteroidota bacterium]
MKKLILIVALFCVAQMDIAVVNAQQLTIGYVDPNSILAKMPEMAAVDRKLKNFMEKKQKEFADKEAGFRDQMAAYEQKKAVISADARTREETKLNQLRQELMVFDQQYQQEMQQKQAEYVGPLYKQIQDAISAVAKENKMTYIFNTVTTTGDFILLYASDDAQQKYNITEKVIAKLGM